MGITRHLIVLCLTISTFAVSVSANQFVERWGCSDSSGTGDIYFLDIYESKVIYDFRDELMKPQEYRLLSSLENNRVIASQQVELSPSGRKEPDRCIACMNISFLILDRSSKNLLYSSVIVGGESFENTGELKSFESKTKTKCDLLSQ